MGAVQGPPFPHERRRAVGATVDAQADPRSRRGGRGGASRGALPRAGAVYGEGWDRGINAVLGPVAG